jgi:hypothetical protein
MSFAIYYGLKYPLGKIKNAKKYKPNRNVKNKKNIMVNQGKIVIKILMNNYQNYESNNTNKSFY